MTISQGGWGSGHLRAPGALREAVIQCTLDVRDFALSAPKAAFRAFSAPLAEGTERASRNEDGPAGQKKACRGQQGPRHAASRVGPEGFEPPTQGL